MSDGWANALPCPPLATPMFSISYIYIEAANVVLFLCRLANSVVLPVWLRASRAVLQLATCMKPFLIATYE